MQHSILLLALSSLAATSVASSTKWGFITALYCETGAGTQTTTSTQCVDGSSGVYLGINVMSNSGCIFEGYKQANCAGTPEGGNFIFFSKQQLGCSIPGYQVKSVKVTCS